MPESGNLLLCIFLAACCSFERLLSFILQEVVHENQEPDQDNKENIILNSAQTPMKKELVTQNEVGAKVNNLVADKRTSDTEVSVSS